MAEEDKPKTIEDKINTATKGVLKDLRDQRELLKKVNYDMDKKYPNLFGDCGWPFNCVKKDIRKYFYSLN